MPTDRVKDRLEQLDQDDDDGEMLQLTQKEYQRHIERKRESLIAAWNGEKRVRALKIAIKVRSGHDHVTNLFSSCCC